MMTIWICCTLVLGQQDSRPTQSEGWSFDILRPVRPQPLSADPIRVSSNGLFHALFGIPPLESARALEAWRLDVGIAEDLSSGRRNVNTPEFYFQYDATLAETDVDLRLGLPGAWEVRVGFDVSSLLEANENDIILAQSPGTLIVPPGKRNVGFGDLRLNVKKEIFRLGSAALGVSAGTKLPFFADPGDLLSSGGIDFFTASLYTQSWGPVTVHVNVGALFPGEPRIFSGDVDVQTIVPIGGAAICYRFADWGEAIVQVQANGSVFGGVWSVLDSWVVTTHLGARFRVGSYFLEASFGAGLTESSSDRIFTVGLTVPFSL